MVDRSMTRRTMLGTCAAVAVTGALEPRQGRAAEKSVTVGLDVSLTGATAESSKRVQWGALMAFDEVNA